MIMQLRKANEKDREEAIEVAQKLTEWFSKEGTKNIETDFKLNNLVVAVDGGKVSGFLCYSTGCGKMHLIWMGIKKSAQRKGIGKKLLRWLEKESKKYKLHSIEVETLPDEDSYAPYKKTRNFYYKNGFKRILYKKARVEGWDDQIVLEKKLSYL